MTRLLPIGRAFFSLGLVGLGVAHFRFGQFVTGRPPALPEAVPGGPAWAYLSGLAFVGIGFAILARWKARFAALLAAALILAWALPRHLPVVAASSWLSSDWTRAAKALNLAGGSLAVAATFTPFGTAREGSFLRFLDLQAPFVVVGRVCMGLFLILTGIQHFLFTEFVASLIPVWFPGDPVFWTYFAGVALIAGGVGILLPRTALWAASLSGLMVFSWFFIVHVSREIAGIADGISVYEALATAGLLFLIAGYLYDPQTKPEATASGDSPEPTVRRGEEQTMERDRMDVKRNLLRVAVPAAIALALAWGGAPAAASGTPDARSRAEEGAREAVSPVEREVARIRAATAGFRSLDVAVAAGYRRDVAHCIANPPQGAMGYHHENRALLDDVLDVERPEILVYERLPDGEYRLNGVEYIVPFSVWPGDREPPTVMGRELKPAPSLRLWYLHVWVWLENPSGLFADWNPRVTC